MEEVLTQFINTLVDNGILPEESAQEVYDNLLQSEYLESIFDPETGLLLSGVFNEIAYITDSLGIITPLFVTLNRLFDVNHLAELEEKLMLTDPIELMFDPVEPTNITVIHQDTIKINYNIDLTEGLGMSFAINAINKILTRERYQYEVGEIFDNGADYSVYIVTPGGQIDNLKEVLAQFLAEGEISDYQGLIETDLNPTVIL